MTWISGTYLRTTAKRQSLHLLLPLKLTLKWTLSYVSPGDVYGHFGETEESPAMALTN